MKTFKALHLIAFLAAFLSCTCTAQTAQSVVKLQVISGLPVVNGVFLNEQGPYRFLLDTGEQSNEMDSELARTLGLSPTFQAELDTPAGPSGVNGTQVGKVVLGSVQAERQEFLISGRDRLRRLGPDIRGTLGQEFLSHFDYTLDFKNHRLTFGTLPQQGTQVSFQLSYGCMVIRTDFGELMLDSGSDSLVFFRAGPHFANAVITTSNANIEVSVERAPTLRIGGKRYFPSNAAYHPLADAPADGILPAGLFRAIFVSNSEHYVIFDPIEPKPRE